MNTVKDKVVMITGANRGIGKAYALEFLRAGAKKIYVASRKLENIKSLIQENPGKFVGLELDVTNPAHIEAAVAAAPDVDIIVNNAGILFFDVADAKTAISQARQQMEVNYIAPLAIAHAFAPILKKNGGGIFITVSSIAGHTAFPGITAYSASKFAAHALIMGLRLQFDAQKTRVMGVYPGPIDTDMARDFPMEKTPPEQVAKATIEAIVSGATDDVFPDAVAREMYAALRADPQAMEAQMLEMSRQQAQAA